MDGDRARMLANQMTESALLPARLYGFDHDGNRITHDGVGEPAVAAHIGRVLCVFIDVPPGRWIGVSTLLCGGRICVEARTTTSEVSHRFTANVPVTAEWGTGTFDSTPWA